MSDIEVSQNTIQSVEIGINMGMVVNKYYGYPDKSNSTIPEQEINGNILDTVTVKHNRILNASQGDVVVFGTVGNLILVKIQ